MLQKILTGLLFLPLLFTANTALSLTISDVKARVPRGIADRIELSFQLLGITPSDVQVVGASEVSATSIHNLIVSQLDICIDPRSDVCRGAGNLKAEYQGEREKDATAETDFDNLNIITITGEINVLQDPNAENRYDADIYMTIRPNDEKRRYTEKTKVVLAYPSGSQQDIVVQVEVSSIVTSDLSGLSMHPGNQSLTVRWNPLQAVDFADGSTGNASAVRVYLLETKADQDRYELRDIMVGFEENVEDENTYYSCDLTIDNREEGSESCTFSCDNGNNIAYIKRSQVEELDKSKVFSITISEVPASSSSLTFPNLQDTSKQYAAFAQILPDGARSASDTSCVMGSPIITFSYAQITGGDTPSLEDPHCFIATAAYGSSLHQNLDDLRWFRDHILRKMPGGEQLIQLYYQSSPPVAQWIKEHPLAAKIVRSVLYGPVQLIRWLRAEEQK